MRIHLIAIGGSAMHNLALALQANGHQVSGSDDEIYDPARSRLANAGLLPASIGWDADRITPEIDVIILGMHARKNNPELIKAQNLGLEIHSYPSFLYQQAKEKKRVVIAGSHGKTTTTSLIMHVLRKSNTSYDYLVGAQLPDFDRMVRLSDSPLVILEGDEYLSSPLDARPKILHYRPHLAVITGIAWDHINVFPTFEDYLDSFRKFLQSIEPGGTVFYFEGDAVLQKLIEEAPSGIQCIPYRAVPSGEKEGQVLLEGAPAEWNLFGNYNRQNLQAAWQICKSLGVSRATFAEALKSFNGPALRMQQKYASEDLMVFRDFAHAPSKLMAGLKGLREQFPERKLKVVFELHTFSSLNKDFIPLYKGALDPADEAVVFFLPHTLEMKQMPPLDHGFIKSAFGRQDIKVITSTTDLKNWLENEKQKGGVFAMMSSGNFGNLGE
ncbi:MAG: peptidoglycan synthetase [Bacteroidetes bacterium]|nr:peptidoglycan synthetase [Bacteroidota bacterium]